MQLDSLKQKGAVKRTLFLENHQSHLIFPLVIKQQKSHQCQDFMVYLRVSVPESPFWPLTFKAKFQLCFSTSASYCPPLFSYYRRKVYYKDSHFHFQSNFSSPSDVLLLIPMASFCFAHDLDTSTNSGGFHF